jgi:hypothetical protein
MSKRKDESPAEYSARMSAYQQARRLKEAGSPVPATLKPKQHIPRGRPRAQAGPHSSSAETLERQRAKITLAGKFIPDGYAAEKPKALCYGDVYRAQKEAAGLVGAPIHSMPARATPLSGRLKPPDRATSLIVNGILC